jgi:F0F1-type ATP synthase membrane subunit b/b'
MAKTKTLRDHASELADTLSPRVEHARDLAAPLLADARTKAAPVLADVRVKTAPLLDDARAKVSPVFEDARARVAPVLVDAREKAAPVLADAREKAAPYVADARDRLTTEVLPVVTAALATVDAATADARHETAKRGKAVAAALRGEVEPPQKKHRGRTLLLLLGLGAAVGAIARTLGKRQPTTNWQSSYTPPPAPTEASSGGPVAGVAPDGGLHRADRTPDDIAASTPGEAASDATDVPHDATTPDNPVEEIDVEKQ